MEKILNYTLVEIEKIAHNYLILTSKHPIQVLRIIRANPNTTINSMPSIEVRVKILTRFGKELTEKIYIHPQGDHPIVTGSGFKHITPNELLAMDLLPNPVFEKSFEEAIKEAEEIEIKRKHTEFVEKIKREINYNLKQSRKATAAKRSYKKYSIESLEVILTNLEERQQIYLQQVIDALKELPKETIKEFIAKFKGAKKELFESIEKSFEAKEKYIFEKALLWFRKYDEIGLNEAELIKKAEEYIIEQKWNLFKSVVNHLGEYDIVKVKNIHFHNTNNGFEGSWALTLANGTIKEFTTKTIIAEGYIQRAHYRYLVNIK